jgi:hypothetical protein
VEAVEGMSGQPSGDAADEIDIFNAGPWVRFCDLADGSFVALKLQHTYEKGWKVVRLKPGASPADSPIVAWSFQDFLSRALGSGGRLDELGEQLSRPLPGIAGFDHVYP